MSWNEVPTVEEAMKRMHQDTAVVTKVLSEVLASILANGGGPKIKFDNLQEVIVALDRAGIPVRLGYRESGDKFRGDIEPILVIENVELVVEIKRGP